MLMKAVEVLYCSANCALYKESVIQRNGTILEEVWITEVFPTCTDVERDI